jgi:hypothetical protein
MPSENEKIADEFEVPPAPDWHKRRIEVVACFGMAAASLAGLLSLLGVTQLDNSLMTALYCFAISLPANVGYGYLFNAIEPLHDRITDSKFLNRTWMLSIGIAFVGFVAIFLHFSSGAAVVFAVASIVMPLVVGIAAATGALEKAKKNKKAVDDGQR